MFSGVQTSWYLIAFGEIITPCIYQLFERVNDLCSVSILSLSTSLQELNPFHSGRFHQWWYLVVYLRDKLLPTDTISRRKICKQKETRLRQREYFFNEFVCKHTWVWYSTKASHWKLCSLHAKMNVKARWLTCRRNKGLFFIFLKQLTINVFGVFTWWATFVCFSNTISGEDNLQKQSYKGFLLHCSVCRHNITLGAVCYTVYPSKSFSILM